MKDKRLSEKKKLEEIEMNIYNFRKFFNARRSIKDGFKPQTRIFSYAWNSNDGKEANSERF